MIKKLLMILITAILLGGCETDNTEQQRGTVTLAPGTEKDQIIYADETETKNALSFSTTGAWQSAINYTKAADDNWIQLTPDRGNAAGDYNVSISISPNNTGASRKATINIMCGDNSISVSIEQKEIPKEDAKEGLILKTQLPIPAFEAQGGSQALEFESKQAWTITVDNRVSDWLSVSEPSGKEGDHTIGIIVSANDTPDERNGSITLKSGAITEHVTVTQKQKDALTVTSSKFEVGNKGGNINVEVKANINFEVDIKDNWIHKSDVRSLTTTNLSFTVDPNESSEKREGSILIKSGDLVETIKVYQIGETVFVLSKKEFDVSDAGETISIEINSNIDYNVILPEGGWITENMMRAVSSSTRYFTIAPNTGHDAREAAIQFSATDGSGLTESVIVRQNQKDALILGKDVMKTAKDGGVVEVKLKANINFTTEIKSDWIEQLNVKSLEDHSLKFFIKNNPGIESRRGEVVFKYGEKSQTLYIDQNGIDTIDIKIKDYSIGHKGGTVDVDVLSNLPYNVYILEDASLSKWIKLKDITYEQNTSVSKVQFVIEPNNTLSFREVKINFGIQPDKPLQTITIRQSSEESMGEIHLDEAGTLSTKVTQEELAKFTSLKITGHMNQEDEAYFKDKEAPFLNFALTYLDISGVTFESGSITGFSSLKNLTEVKLPENIVNLKQDAFNYCTSLVKVDFGTNSKLEVLWGSRYQDMFRDTWPVGPFANCTSLVEINIPSSVTSMQAGAFSNCTALTAVNIPENSSISALSTTEYTAFNGVTYYTSTQGMFEGCTALKTIKIPASVKVITKEAFKGWTGVESIEIPESVTNLGTEGLFMDCKNLVSVKLPSSVSTIEKNMFKGCALLEDIQLKKKLTSIGDYGLSGCKSLETIDMSAVTHFGVYSLSGMNMESFTVPTNMAGIPDGFLSRCENLTTVTLGKVVSIGASAFDGCKSLPSITIPATVTSIGGEAFAGCIALREFNLTGGDIVLGEGMFGVRDIDGAYVGPQITSFFIPKGITSITSDGNSVFLNSKVKDIVFEAGSQCHTFGICGSMEFLTKIELPNSIETLSEYAFNYCKNLSSVTLSTNLKTIGSFAFSNCANLTKITLPNSLKEIGEYAFSRSSFTSVSIPEGTEKIMRSAFAESSRLTNVKLPSTLNYLFNDAFNKCSVLTDCIINGNDLEVFPGPIFSGTLITQVVIGKSVKSLKGKFLTNNNIKSVLFEDGSQCEKIEEVFSGSFISEINLPKSLKVIGKETFTNIPTLKSIVIPEGVIEIGERMLSYSGVTKVTLPNTLRKLAANAFNQCVSLTDFVLNGDHLEITGSRGNELLDATAVTKLIVGSNVKSLTCLFTKAENQKLPPLLPETIKSIEFETGSQCEKVDGILIGSQISEINLPSSIKTIANHMFAYMPNIKTINIPEGVTEIGELVVTYSGVTKITLPNTLKTLLSNAFTGASSLSDFVLNGDDLEIKKGVVNEGTLLDGTLVTKLIIGSNVKSLVCQAVVESPDSYMRVLSDKINSLEFEDGSRCENIEGVFARSSISEVKLPASLKTIGDCAFLNAQALASVKLNEGVTTIGKNAFRGCLKITELIAPNSLTLIDDNAFYGCTALTKVSFPKVAIIGSRVFSSAKITELTLPSLVKTGELILDFNSAIKKIDFGPSVTQFSLASTTRPSIAEATIRAVIPPIISNHNFHTACIIKVPASSIGEYKKIFPRNSVVAITE